MVNSFQLEYSMFLTGGQFFCVSLKICYNQIRKGENMDKRTLILDALLELIRADKGAPCTISDIAKQAGIAKGGIYYYFSSKEEIMDALVERSYGQVIDHCQVTIEHVELSALPKLALLLEVTMLRQWNIRWIITCMNLKMPTAISSPWFFC